MVGVVIALARQGFPAAAVAMGFVAEYVLCGPFLRLTQSPVSGFPGLLILFYGLRTAWQMAAGTPGFGQPGAARLGFRGVRR